MAKDRKLSVEDRILWSKVAKSTRPLPERQSQMDAFDAFLVEDWGDVVGEAGGDGLCRQRG